MTTADSKPTEKKPYHPPAIVAEEVFETLALACAKDPGGLCEFNPPTKS